MCLALEPVVDLVNHARFRAVGEGRAGGRRNCLHSYIEAGQVRADKKLPRLPAGQCLWPCAAGGDLSLCLVIMSCAPLTVNRQHVPILVPKSPTPPSGCPPARAVRCRTFMALRRRLSPTSLTLQGQGAAPSSSRSSQSLPERKFWFLTGDRASLLPLALGSWP